MIKQPGWVTDVRVCMHAISYWISALLIFYYCLHRIAEIFIYVHVFFSLSLTKKYLFWSTNIFVLPQHSKTQETVVHFDVKRRQCYNKHLDNY